MARNGPPVLTPGFGSKVSSWLAPPASQSMMQRFCCCLSSAAMAGDERMELMPVMSAANAAPAPMAAPRKPRRSSEWAAEPQKKLRVMLRPHCDRNRHLRHSRKPPQALPNLLPRVLTPAHQTQNQD